MACQCNRVMTDNGACYRAGLFAQTLANARVAHQRTRAYRPQTNGKAERFNQTLLDEWAYARSYAGNSNAWPSCLLGRMPTTTIDPTLR
jgi:transposase InsO family protein